MVKFSLRNRLYPDYKEFGKEPGDLLLAPYLDGRLYPNPRYSGVMDNINAEFRRLTKDDNVEIKIDGGIYILYIFDDKLLPSYSHIGLASN